MNETENQDETQYFWREKDYRYNTMMKNIKKLALEDGFSNDDFDILKYHFETQMENQNRIDIYNQNHEPQHDVDDTISSFLLELNKAELSRSTQCASFVQHEVANTESKIKNYSHKNIDLHGFTKNGARQEVRRVLLNIDRRKKNTIKFNVGKGKHSFANRHQLPSIVYEVCKNLGLHQPTISTKNQGYLTITIDPKSVDDPIDFK